MAGYVGGYVGQYVGGYLGYLPAEDTKRGGSARGRRRFLQPDATDELRDRQYTVDELVWVAITIAFTESIA